MLRRSLRLMQRLARLGSARLRDLLCTSYARRAVSLRALPLSPLPAADAALLPDEVAALYLANRHDLLGSGWCDWTARGRQPVNLANRRHAARLRRKITQEYRPLDWHLDSRAGYHWPARRWSRWILPGRPAGVDIKLPWELARMQHLLPLALDSLDHPRRRGERARLFRDQVLDFMASNPPRFGVNWRTPMDVAIRAANWAVVYSLYKSAGESFDEAFEQALAEGLLDHGRHIVRYMEWDPVWRANHYLANICGLAVIGAVLPRGPESDAWLAFACRELVSEVERQINPDGSVFEASTGYHRLSIEMVVYSTAVLLGCVQRGELQHLVHPDATSVPFIVPLSPEPMALYVLPGHDGVMTPFPPAYFERLAAAAAFLQGVTKPDGHVPLIGDNDSGRFLRTRFVGELLAWPEAQARYVNLAGVPAPPGVSRCPVEDQRDHRYLLGAVAGLVEDPQLAAQGDAWQTEYQLVRALSGGLAAAVTLPAGASTVATVAPEPLPTHARCLRIPVTDSAVFQGLQALAFPDFGLYLWRAPRLYLALRCGPIGQGGFGGHAHNDQLAVELQIDGRDLISDPGVYRYTVDPEERRRYRSVQAHFAPRLGEREPGSLALGPWRLGDEAQARLEQFDAGCIQARHHGFGAAVHRRIWRDGQHLCIADWGDGGLVPDDPAVLFSRLNEDATLVPFCPGYGVQHG